MLSSECIENGINSYVHITSSMVTFGRFKNDEPGKFSTNFEINRFTGALSVTGNPGLGFRTPEGIFDTITGNCQTLASNLASQSSSTGVWPQGTCGEHCARTTATHSR